MALSTFKNMEALRPLFLRPLLMLLLLPLRLLFLFLPLFLRHPHQ